MGLKVSKSFTDLDVENLVEYYLNLNNIPGNVKCIGLSKLIIDLPMGIYNEDEIKDEIKILTLECFKINFSIYLYQLDFFL